MFEKLADHIRNSDIDYRLLVPLLLSSLLVQTVTALVRVTISYRAVELGLSLVWLGLIAATFAIFPILIAVQVGRLHRPRLRHAHRIGRRADLPACR